MLIFFIKRVEFNMINPIRSLDTAGQDGPVRMELPGERRSTEAKTNEVFFNGGSLVFTDKSCYLKDQDYLEKYRVLTNSLMGWEKFAKETGEKIERSLKEFRANNMDKNGNIDRNFSREGLQDIQNIYNPTLNNIRGYVDEIESDCNKHTVTFSKIAAEVLPRLNKSEEELFSDLRANVEEQESILKAEIIRVKRYILDSRLLVTGDAQIDNQR